MRSLVLGGAGFIGVHLCRRLLAEGHSVTIVDNFSRGRHDPELDALDVPVINADLTDAAAYATIPHGWDHIYQLVAVVGVRYFENEPARTLRVNTLSVLHMLDWLEEGSSAKVFFASTSEAYAGGVSAGVVPVPTPETVPLMIEDITAPRWAYGASKLLGEAAVIHLCAAKRVRHVVARFHNVYGPRMGAAHVIPELSLRAIRGENPFTVYGVDQRRAFCYVDDAVDGIYRAMTTDSLTGEIVHIGNDTDHTNIGDLADLILKIADFQPELVPLPAPAGSVARRCPDITKLRSRTGFRPRVSLEDGVQRTFEWYRDVWRANPGTA
ncbi:NAD-dependent epimerase/dehydratase family protein [Actinophytocola oryzae]|uniref:UDP-glucose 4-epimerase/UDP-glucuronate decarboxylase n=1 Tax=Actinophytocola oryzae TaxID=502181 RepID=A0A4R7VFF5_9PSEU|nr:NAD-dependent epimerase/dehydratase family protein [Actinophytocola oryzae]TDV47966.1 UDP-glucose 4-epimerase/UDP-glucuronate decarboxylase [Actinophytocola oryzae]